MTLNPSLPITSPAATRRRRPEASRRRRAFDAVAFVAVWVTAGYLLPVDANGYLLLGIPLTAGFQVLVRRRPLRELFAAGTTRFHLGGRGLAVAAALAAVPGYRAIQAVSSGDLTLLGWHLAAVAGAFCAAFALRAGSVRAALRSAALPIAVAAGGVALVLGTVHLATGTPLSHRTITTIATYTALYFPAAFLLEEVTFRGALDAHLHHEGEARGWRSAIAVSALWGIWHLPVSSGLPLPLPLKLAELLVVHVLIGVPLSFAWRRTRDLAGPALAHAAIDAVRNAFMLGL
jgi:hypothetical protein